jgi:hypothetical protein
MTYEEVEGLLRTINPTEYELLEDCSTYRVSEQKTDLLTKRPKNAGIWPTKMLILTDGKEHAIGIVIFWGNADILIQMLPEYCGKGYMSAIHKNGILRSECYENQHVKIDKDYVTSMDDLRKKCHLLRLAGLKPDNLDEIYDYMCWFTDFPGMTGIDKEHFFQELT